MGQKVQPIGIRLGIVEDWSAKWYSDRDYSTYLISDLKARRYISKRLSHASVGRVEIERSGKEARVIIHTARPGVIIGKSGSDVELIRAELKKIMGVDVKLNIEEIRRPEVDAILVAQQVAEQLQRRVMFRRAMKRAISNALKGGALGIKIQVGGRLGGAEIARSERYHDGRVPLHTLRAKIDYSIAEAKTTYGIIGVKVWIFKGEVFKRKRISETAQ